MEKIIKEISNALFFVVLALALCLALGACQTGQSLDQKGLEGRQQQTEINAEAGTGPEGQLPGQESFGEEPQLRPEGEGGWENPNQ